MRSFNRTHFHPFGIGCKLVKTLLSNGSLLSLFFHPSSLRTIQHYMCYYYSRHAISPLIPLEKPYPKSMLDEVQTFPLLHQFYLKDDQLCQQFAFVLLMVVTEYNSFIISQELQISGYYLLHFSSYTLIVSSFTGIVCSW